MTMFLLSLGGFPPTAGFIAQVVRLQRRGQAGYYWLAIIGVLTSVVSVFFYLRIVVMMYMTEGPETLRPRIPCRHGGCIAVARGLYSVILPAVFYLARFAADDPRR